MGYLSSRHGATSSSAELAGLCAFLAVIHSVLRAFGAARLAGLGAQRANCISLCPLSRDGGRCQATNIGAFQVQCNAAGQRLWLVLIQTSRCALEARSSTVVAGTKTFNFFLAQHFFFAICRGCGNVIISRAKRVVGSIAYRMLAMYSPQKACSFSPSSRSRPASMLCCHRHHQLPHVRAHGSAPASRTDHPHRGQKLLLTRPGGKLALAKRSTIEVQCTRDTQLRLSSFKVPKFRQFHTAMYMPPQSGGQKYKKINYHRKNRADKLF